nr:arabinofuranosidase catalytic domain-containing protein [Streptomyces sp. MK5]
MQPSSVAPRSPVARRPRLPAAAAVCVMALLTAGGTKAYSLYINPGNSYWRDGHLTGVPTGAAPEGAYMVTSGTHVNGGTFYGGAIVAGHPSDATDNAVQAGITAAGHR